ncbi:hypothetical protein P4T04_01395 [Bacillus badius]|uniref:hypothetical protein n=1 Tax=Bacillus badius TaxID=1455 RepID=UPI002E1A2A57|nr:hypothetical protein [Bacillus badius]
MFCSKDHHCKPIVPLPDLHLAAISDHSHAVHRQQKNSLMYPERHFQLIPLFLFHAF